MATYNGINASEVYNCVFNFGLEEDINVKVFGENNEILGLKDVQELKKMLAA